MKAISTLILAAALFTGVNSFAQNQFHVSQYMMHHSFINPGAIGNSNALNGAIFYRNQWSGMDGAPTVMGLNFNKPFTKGKNHLGFTVVHDQIGVSKNFEFTLTYAYRMKLGINKYLSLGLSATVSLMQSNLATVQTTDANDPIFSSNTPTFTMPNAKFGAYYFSPKFYVGFAIPNLLENKVIYNTTYTGVTEFNPENLHYYLHSGYSFALSEDFDLNPSVLLKQVAGSPLSIDINVQMMYKKKFGVGASFRTSNELIGLLNYQITDSFRLGYAYDFNWGQLGSFSKGSHEVMLIFRHMEKKGIPAIESPRF
jgi:type IX secretion system PorP/SprF family membrane protein